MMHAFLLIKIPIQRNNISRISVRYLPKWAVLSFFYLFRRCLIRSLKCIGYLYIGILLFLVTRYKVTLQIADPPKAYLIALA